MKRREVRRISKVLEGLPEGTTIVNITIHQTVKNIADTQWIQKESLRVVNCNYESDKSMELNQTQ